jgi:hypothetical protein
VVDIQGSNFTIHFSNNYFPFPVTDIGNEWAGGGPVFWYINFSSQSASQYNSRGIIEKSRLLNQYPKNPLYFYLLFPSFCPGNLDYMGKDNF